MFWERIIIRILRSYVLWLFCGMHIGGTSIFDCLNHCKKPHIGSPLDSIVAVKIIDNKYFVHSKLAA